MPTILISYAAIAILSAVPLVAQDQPRWEYGRLTVSQAAGLTVPMNWSAGDSTVEATALLVAATQVADKKAPDPLVTALNALDAQGWELVEVAPGAGFIFRRRKSR